MIYQTYHDPQTRNKLFPNEPYTGFDLMALGLNPVEQKQLCEYAALRHFYNHPEQNADSWIGFTSINQRTPQRFNNREEVEVVFRQGVSVVVWGWHQFYDAVRGCPLTMADASERCHPGINAVLGNLLRAAGLDGLPPFYTQSNQGPFCNYWAMTRDAFHAYMDWSLPLVEHCLTHLDQPFFQTWPRGVSYIHERLFLCWLPAQDLRMSVVNRPFPVVRIKPRRRQRGPAHADVGVIPSKRDQPSR
jgi:hypothetical protein